MTTTDAKVLRFTGREVFRDVDACADQAFEYIMRIQQDHLNLEVMKFIDERMKNHKDHPDPELMKFLEEHEKSYD